MASDNCTPSVFLVQLGKWTREVRLAESTISVTSLEEAVRETFSVYFVCIYDDGSVLQ